MGQPWEWAQYGWNQWHSEPSAWTQHGHQPPQSLWEFQLHPSAEQQGQFGSTYTTAEDGREQPFFDPNYCLVDASGEFKPFSVSHISQVSGRTYEACVSAIVTGKQSRKLRAVQQQTQQETMRLEACREAVAEFLRIKVSDKVASDARQRGIGAEEMEVDTVFEGSFKALTCQLKKLGGQIHTPGTCDEVAMVLVEICSDSRFVATKLLQLEIQCSLLTRDGFLVRDAKRGYDAFPLDQKKTGFAIVFNRAALQVVIHEVVAALNFTNISNLLVEGKLQIIYFQAETGVPAALQLAVEAQNNAVEAQNNAVEAHKKISELQEQLQQMQGHNFCWVSMGVLCWTSMLKRMSICCEQLVTVFLSSVLNEIDLNMSFDHVWNYSYQELERQR